MFSLLLVLASCCANSWVPADLSRYISPIWRHCNVLVQSKITNAVYSKNCGVVWYGWFNPYHIRVTSLSLGQSYPVTWTKIFRYNDVMMSANTSQITSLTIVYSTVYSGADQRKHQSSASLAFVRAIHRWPVNSPHKGPVTRKMFLFDDVIMKIRHNETVCIFNGIYGVWNKAVAVKISRLIIVYSQQFPVHIFSIIFSAVESYSIQIYDS